jgi:hypothetical protein
MIAGGYAVVLRGGSYWDSVRRGLEKMFVIRADLAPAPARRQLLGIRELMSASGCFVELIGRTDRSRPRFPKPCNTERLSANAGARAMRRIHRQVLENQTKHLKVREEPRVPEFVD